MSDSDIVYLLSQEDRDKISDIVDRGYGRPPLQSPPVRRPRRPPPARRTTTSTGGVLILMIDEDILGITEDEDAILLPDSGETLEDPPGTEVDELNLYAYERRVFDAKYFREATSSDPGYDPYVPKMILATTTADGATIYDTQEVYYDDGADFLVGEYKQSDYPDYDENSTFPPEGLPEGFLNKKWRGIAVKDEDGKWVLVTALCKPLPPPALPES